MVKKLRLLGHQVRLILLDTYFEQELFTGIQIQEQYMPIAQHHLLDQENSNFSKKINTIHKIQSNLFTEYRPGTFADLDVIFIYSKDSSINIEQYNQYLKQKVSGEVHYYLVEGDHYSMLNGAGAIEISSIMTQYFQEDICHV